MSAPYFASIDNVVRLRTELNSWLGTPFRHMCGVKGLGCDCIHFVVRIIETVVVDHPVLIIKPYPQQWHLHQTEELLLQGIVAQVRAIEVPAGQPMDGDIHLFQFGRTISHAGLVCDELLYHAVFGTRLVAIPWNDEAWRGRRRKAFRIVEAA